MAQDPFDGTWKLNAAASSLPFATPRSVVLNIEVDGDNVSLTEYSVDAEGLEETVTIQARFDNRRYPVNGSALVDGFAIERLGESAWRAQGTKAGNLIFTETIVLERDGTRLREDAETTLADGTRAPATLIYKRQ